MGQNMVNLIVHYVLLIVIALQTTTTVGLDSNQRKSSSSFRFMEATNQRENTLSSIASLCLESQPDGVAILTETTTNGGEILTIFKGDSFWLIKTEELSSIFGNNSHNPEPLFFVSNKIISVQVFQVFPNAPDYVISFTGMNKTSEFFNNLLAFKENKLFRYQVNELNFDDGKLTASLISRHVTDHWLRLPHMNDIKFMKINRGSRVLAFEHLWGGIGVSSLYVLNGQNLDSPIEYPIVNYGGFGGILPESFSDTSHYYELGYMKGKLSFLSTGQWCLNETCKLLRDYIKCEPQIDAFANGFAYWVWRSTEMNFRLIMVGLISVMMVNFILALSFMYNQVKRIADLT